MATHGRHVLLQIRKGFIELVVSLGGRCSSLNWVEIQYLSP